jgi:hypothetical protein
VRLWQPSNGGAAAAATASSALNVSSSKDTCSITGKIKLFVQAISRVSLSGSHSLQRLERVLVDGHLL